MKNFILLVFSCLLLVACHEDEPQPVRIDQLVGTWVYDHPEEGIWETQKFLPSGVFYYWNKVSGGWKFQNTGNDGRYWIEENNHVTCQYFLNGVAVQVKMTISEITDYSYTAEYNDGASLGIFTYARLLDNVQIKPEESIQPDYSGLVKANITGFKSHNMQIAIVDASSGQITGVKAGHTYIDVITDMGTAVIEVAVFDYDDMFADYSFAFGKTVPEIVAIFGDNYDYRDDSNGVIYTSEDYLTDEIVFMTGLYDKTHIEYVQLKLNENVSSSKIIEHLSERYSFLSSTDGTYNYVTDQIVNGNPVALIYNSNDATISYAVILPASRWTDFSYLFGQTDGTINSEMNKFGYPYLFSDYSYSKDGSDYYTINDSNDACLVGFVFNGEKKMCEYWIYLYEDFMKDAADILTWLKSKYTLSDTESTNSQYVLYDNTRRMRIVFDATGYVSYTDSEQTPFTPATSSQNISKQHRSIAKSHSASDTRRRIYIPKIPEFVRK